MKSPATYLDEARQEHPEAWPAGGIPHIPKAQAERALQAALADAAREKETYAHLLLRACRNATPTPPHEPA